MSTETEVWFLLIDHQKNIIGRLGSVVIPKDHSVERLKAKIKETNSIDLAHVDARNLMVWRFKDETTSSKNVREMPQIIKEVKFSPDNDDVELVDPRRTIEQHGLASTVETLLMQIPGLTPEIDVRALGTSDSSHILSDENTYIIVRDWSRYFIEDDLTRNNLSDHGNNSELPIFVKEFEKMFLSRPLYPSLDENETDIDDRGSENNAFPNEGLADGTAPSEIHNAYKRRTFDSYVKDLDSVIQGWKRSERIAEINERKHINFLSIRDYSIISSPYELLDEDITYYDFFRPLQKHASRTRTGDITIKRNKKWKLKVLFKKVTLGEPRETVEISSYAPQSYFSIEQSTLPRLLCEFDSEGKQGPWPTDRVRMLLQGAAVVRYANKWLEAFRERKDFVLPAIYIYKNGTVFRHLMFQQPGEAKTVYYTHQHFTFNLSQWPANIKFVTHLYNLFLWLTGDTKVVGAKDLSERIKQECKSGHVKTFTSLCNRNRKNNGRKRGFNDEDGPGAGADNGGNQESAALQLAMHNYTVISDVLGDDGAGGLFERIFTTPSHVIRVYRGTDCSTQYIAKDCSKRPEELQMLKDLKSMKPPSPHIIPLVESFVSGKTPWVILPSCRSLREIQTSAPSVFRARTMNLCQGLIDGVAFLHTHLIAHRDLKPDNLVCNASKQLQIIDFGLALTVADENEVVEGYCGTAGWTAPEVGEQDEPEKAYSPIRADRWATGRLLLYILEGTSTSNQYQYLERYSEALQNTNPLNRPPVNSKWETMYRSIIDTG